MLWIKLQIVCLAIGNDSSLSASGSAFRVSMLFVYLYALGYITITYFSHHFQHYVVKLILQQLPNSIPTDVSK